MFYVVLQYYQAINTSTQKMVSCLHKVNKPAVVNLEGSKNRKGKSALILTSESETTWEPTNGQNRLVYTSLTVSLESKQDGRGPSGTLTLPSCSFSILISAKQHHCLQQPYWTGSKSTYEHTSPKKNLMFPIQWVLCLEQVEQLYPKPNHLLHLQISSNF